MVDKFINTTLKVSYIVSVPIKYFTTEELKDLSNKAKKNNILITLKMESSNVHQGVLVNLIRKDIINKEFIEFL